MSCNTCGAYDAQYRDGWCMDYDHNTAPTNHCGNYRSGARTYNYHTCSSCYRFDNNYHNGYCKYHNMDTTPHNSCSEWQA